MTSPIIKACFFFALEHYYAQGFTYIEIGDGDELYENKSRPIYL